MKRKLNYFYLSLLGFTLLTLGACNKNDDVGPEPQIPDHIGMYILNEGRFGQSDATLGFFTLNSQQYNDNVFSEINDGATLGDNANDMLRHGAKLYVTVTESNKIEVLDYSNGEIIATIPMNKPRSLAYAGNKIFVTNYNNHVVAIDTSSLEKTDSIQVGRTPEEIVRFNGRLYVANSGSENGWSTGEFDNRVFVLNPSPLSIDRTIEVADNVTSLTVDSVRSRIFANAVETNTNPSSLYVINTQTNESPVKFNYGAKKMLVVGNQALLISDNFEDDKNIVLLMDLTTRDAVKFIDNEEIKYPYGLGGIELGEIWIADAGDFTSKGKIHRYANNGSPVGNIEVGIAPKKIILRQ
ncbi:YncE family protein [Olivibacter sp. SDN3]|uniref:YncE family protein n=1 Tax=Olivibacter sp. SDN3 TaxID=2764720 RepID=UPI001650EBEA|nr:YncE family protein [Olivibacter sp. SDN3]QNL48601.1 YncE family protein [Olivibacter sp. SDN3]